MFCTIWTGSDYLWFQNWRLLYNLCVNFVWETWKTIFVLTGCFMFTLKQSMAQSEQNKFSCCLARRDFGEDVLSGIMPGEWQRLYGITVSGRLWILIIWQHQAVYSLLWGNSHHHFSFNPDRWLCLFQTTLFGILDCLFWRFLLLCPGADGSPRTCHSSINSGRNNYLKE